MIGILSTTSSCGQRTRSWVCAGRAGLACALAFDQEGGCGVTGCGASGILRCGGHRGTLFLLEHLSIDVVSLLKASYVQMLGSLE